MKMLFIRLVMVLLATFGVLPVSAAPYLAYDARTLSMGGAGVADSLLYATYNNPALLPFDVEFLTWQVIPSWLKSEPDADNFVSELAGFQAADATLSGSPSVANANAAAAELQDLPGVNFDGYEITSLNVVIPSSVMGGAVFINKIVYKGVRAVVGNIDVTNPAAPVYNSTLEKRGLSLVEQGVSFAHFYGDGPRDPTLWALGFSPKLVLAQSLVTSEDITTANSNISFTGSNSGSAFNLDIGILKYLGRYSFALNAKNIIGMKFKTVAGDTFEIQPQYRAGIAYVKRTLSWNVDLDLSTNQGVGFTDETQFLAVGGELHINQYINLRAGLRQNLKAGKDTAISAGAGLMLGSGHHVDVAILKSDEENVVSALFGIQF